MDIFSWIKLILGLIAWLGIPAIMQYEEAEKHGYLHGQSLFVSGGILNLLFLFGLIWLFNNVDLGINTWLATNWVLFILIIIMKIDKKRPH